MREFFNDYFNIKRIFEEKRKYKKLMAQVNALPDDYSFVFKQIQSHMWMFAAGSGYDMMAIHADLIALFEEGAANGKPVLEVTGNDVTGFCDELLKGAQTYTENWRTKMNREIHQKLDGKNR
jgi:DNA-binding ferritin-like protein (Dps family)